MKNFILIFLLFSTQAFAKLVEDPARFHKDKDKSVLLCSYVSVNNDYHIDALRLEWEDWDHGKIVVFPHAYLMLIFHLQNKMENQLEVFSVVQHTFMDENPPTEIEAPLSKEKIRFFKENLKGNRAPGFMEVQSHELKISERGMYFRNECGMECTKIHLIDINQKGSLPSLCPKKP